MKHYINFSNLEWYKLEARAYQGVVRCIYTLELQSMFAEHWNALAIVAWVCYVISYTMWDLQFMFDYVCYDMNNLFSFVLSKHFYLCLQGYACLIKSCISITRLSKGFNK